MRSEWDNKCQCWVQCPAGRYWLLTRKEIELEGGSVFFLVLHGKYQTVASPPLRADALPHPQELLCLNTVLYCVYSTYYSLKLFFLKKKRKHSFNFSPFLLNCRHLLSLYYSILQTWTCLAHKRPNTHTHTHTHTQYETQQDSIGSFWNRLPIPTLCCFLCIENQ